MWEKIKRIEVVISIIVGLIVLGSSIAFPSLIEKILGSLNELAAWAQSPTSIPNILILFLTTVFLTSLYKFVSSRLNVRKYKAPKLPTHEEEYHEYIIRYYIDEQKNEPVFVPPLLCAKCRGKVDKLFTFTYDPSSIYVTCINKHNPSKKLLPSNETSPKLLIDIFSQEIASDFIHQWKENHLFSNLQGKQ